MKKAYGNNFGFLRLAFATMVIVGHSFEMMDGNRSREPLSYLFGGMSLGEVAVDGFFIISGYLVLKSYEGSASATEYLLKRIRRIYPGFLVAVAFCFILLPVVGGENLFASGREAIRGLLGAIILNGPPGPAFPGTNVNAINGSLWSIPVEFRCYLLVFLLAALGAYRKTWLLLVLTLALLILTAIHFRPIVPYTATLTGDPYLLIRGFGLFCVGSLYFKAQDAIPFKHVLAFISAALLTVCFLLNRLPELCFAIFGSYLIFWFAFGIHNPIVSRINSERDISYGVYLYAWPLQGILLYWIGISDPRLLAILATCLAYVCGFASWHFIESPFLGRRKSQSKAQTGDVSKEAFNERTSVELPR